MVAVSMATGRQTRAAAWLLIAAGQLALIVVASVETLATLWFFGTEELLGHLPIYGAMLVLPVYGADPQLRPAVSALWPWGSARGLRRREPEPAPQPA